MNVIEANELGKRYGSTWALRECTVALPEGHVTALVGPNGAGKTTLLNLAVGLTDPSSGTISVLSGRRAGSLAALRRDRVCGAERATLQEPVGRRPAARGASLSRQLRPGLRRASPRRTRYPVAPEGGEDVGWPAGPGRFDVGAGAGRKLLVLDAEPLANLDPLAREDFMATVMTAAAEDGVSVVLSSHVLAELERVADYLVLVSHGNIQVAGEVEDLLEAHRMLIGPVSESARYTQHWNIVHASSSASQIQLLVRYDLSNPTPPGWQARSVSLEELTMAYLREAGAAIVRPDPRLGRHVVGGGAMTAVTIPVRPAKDTGLRPPPWHRMAWVTWRHHRIALAGVAAFLGALAVWLWTAGLPLHHAYAAAASCQPSSSAACQNLINAFQSTNVILKGGFVLQAIPLLIGAFVGAPLLAREFETGTFRYAWTQGFGRWRWTVAKLVLVGVAVAAIASAFSALVSWYYQPYLASGHGGRVLLTVPAFSRAIRLAWGRLRGLDPRRLRDRCPRRHAHPTDRPSDRRHPRRLYRPRLAGRERVAPALPDHRWLRRVRTCPMPRGSRANGGPRAGVSRSVADRPSRSSSSSARRPSFLDLAAE